MFTRLPLTALAVLASLTTVVHAAINPEEFRRAATEVVQVRELARIVEHDRQSKPRTERVTLLVEVVSVHRADDDAVQPGSILLIDYSRDLVALEKAARAHAARGPMPGPQFMHEPAPPVPDENGEYTAYLTRSESRSRRYAGQVSPAAVLREGRIFQPAAGQYSFRERASSAFRD